MHTLTAAANSFQNNGFMLSESKTQPILFRSRPLPGNYTIDKFSTLDLVKSLGIVIGHRLTLGQPIEFVTLKLARTNLSLKKSYTN